MKRYIFIVVLFHLYIQCLYSQEVSIEEAKEVAIWMMEQNCQQRQARGLNCNENPQISTVKTFTREGLNTMYAVNMQTGGYVLVAADERVTPVLAMSDEASFSNDTTDMPPAMKALLADYENTIIHVRNSQLPIATDPMWVKVRAKEDLATEEQKSVSGYVPGTHLLDVPDRGHVHWNQDVNKDYEKDEERFYNKFCPDWGKGKCPAGCVATAIAQIMWYWQWPYFANVPAKIYMSGITYGGTLFHEYDWNLMPQHIDRFTPMNEIDMIATFLRDCGYACNSIYTVNGTSSTLYEARGALQNNFSYDSQNVQWRMFSNKKNWDKKLKDEIDALRPVLYAGGNGELEGHSFVVDGYHPTNKDLFLVNFGWGHYDGFDNKDSHYYCLKTYHDCDSVISYHNFQMALCGIQPKCSEIATLENISVSDNKNKPMYATYHGNMYLDNVNVTSSGRLICHAGSSIRLTSGTKISKGQYFKEKSCHSTVIMPIQLM